MSVSPSCYDIYASFDCTPPYDIRGILLDKSKAFDRVWHDVIKCKPLSLVQPFLKSKFQRVILNGQTSAWLLGLADVPQSSILEPLFFSYLYNRANKRPLVKKLCADEIPLNL